MPLCIPFASPENSKVVMNVLGSQQNHFLSSVGLYVATLPPNQFGRRYLTSNPHKSVLFFLCRPRLLTLQVVCLRILPCFRPYRWPTEDKRG